jgi:hypothetical protein
VLLAFGVRGARRMNRPPELAAPPPAVPDEA